MSTSYNRVIEVGRLTRDPELNQTTGGLDVANFSIAVDRIGKSDDVDFFECETWRDQATNLAAFKKKGDLVLVEGRLKQNRFKDKDGNNRSKVVIVADNVTYFPRSSGAAEATNTGDDDDTEIPF